VSARGGIDVGSSWALSAVHGSDHQIMGATLPEGPLTYHHLINIRARIHITSVVGPGHFTCGIQATDRRQAQLGDVYCPRHTG
jgi:hypothetical protein